MKITRTSMATGTERTKEIDVTQEQIDAWNAGGLIQVVMPHLSVWEREFLMSGMTEEEWNAYKDNQKFLKNRLFRC